MADTLKRPRGRPEGSTKPIEETRKPHTITLSDAAWKIAEGTGNASAFIEGLIIPKPINTKK